MSHKTTRETAVQARVNDGSHIIRSLQYSLQYGTDTNHVYIEPKPHDCDFDKAPRGDKECHFDRIVTTDNSGKDRKVTVYVGWQKVEEVQAP